MPKPVFLLWIDHAAIYHQRFGHGYVEISHPVQGRQRRATEIAHDLSIQKYTCFLLKIKQSSLDKKRDRTALAPDGVQLFLGLQNIVTTY